MGSYFRSFISYAAFNNVCPSNKYDGWRKALMHMQIPSCIQNGVMAIQFCFHSHMSKVAYACPVDPKED